MMADDILHPRPRRLIRPSSVLALDDSFDKSHQPPVSEWAHPDKYHAVLKWLGDFDPPRATSAPIMNTGRSLLSMPPPPTPRSAPPPSSSAGPHLALPHLAPSHISSLNFTCTPLSSGYNEAEISTYRSNNTVADPLYRQAHLGRNGVVLLRPDQVLPPSLQALEQQMRAGRTSPQPDVEFYQNDEKLIDLEEGTDELEVERYMHNKVFIIPHSIKRSDKKRMFQGVVPNDPTARYSISTPTPDSAYGYDRNNAFPEHHVLQLSDMGKEPIANGHDLLYPFLAIEFKADGPFRSSGLWVATNQCLGAASACVKIANTLNTRLRQCRGHDDTLIDCAAFSIAMSGTEARLFISWHAVDSKYYTRKLESYLLQKPEDFIDFRRHVRNIIDWGRTERLAKIQEALDEVLETGRLEASAKAKSRAPPLGNIDARSSVRART